jgi:hypothetical protein
MSGLADLGISLVIFGEGILIGMVFADSTADKLRARIEGLEFQRTIDRQTIRRLETKLKKSIRREIV